LGAHLAQPIRRILSQIIIAFIGVPVGRVAGLVGGWFDFTLMRPGREFLSSIPMLFFYILLLNRAGRGYQNISAGPGAGPVWIGIARLVRARC